MGYYKQLNKSAEWLVSIQNQTNFGWGLSPGQGTSIVNTAEAVYVLSQTQSYHTEIKKGIDFIQSRLQISIDKQGNRTRYVFFALLGLIDNLDKSDVNFVNKWSEWLIKARNKDGAWGHEANDEQSLLFPTCMSLIILHRLNYKIQELETGYNWLASKVTDLGWSFGGSNQPSTTATAIAICALRNVRDADDPIFEKPKIILLQNERWATEREDHPGTLWEHSSYMWIFPAMFKLEIDPYNKTIAEGVRHINEYNCNHGWKEPSGGVTVRGQFWAVVAFEAVHMAFDPAIHPYRIESSIAQSALREPEYVNIRVHSSWSMIIPSKVYRLFTYSLLTVSFIAFLGIHRLANLLNRWFDFGVAIIFFVAVYFLVQKRKTLFSNSFWGYLFTIVAVLSFIDLVFDYSVKQIFEFITEKINQWSINQQK
ncbi:MAG: hypothetical protein QM535_20875 [Limnohabitans sp.]|nr:hypothetical protein [Limnohabitans sp.]